MAIQDFLFKELRYYGVNVNGAVCEIDHDGRVISQGISKINFQDS